jgi:hypothetical protein
VTLSVSRHRLEPSLYAGQGLNTWRSRYPDTVRFKVNEVPTSVFASVATEARKGPLVVRAYTLPHPDSVEGARGMRFYDFRPFEFHDPAQPPSEGLLFEAFSNGRRLQAVRFSRANAKFLELVLGGKYAWVKLARAADARNRRFDAVVNCGQRTEALNDTPVWVERPEACALAVVTDDFPEGSLDVVVSAHQQRN